MLFSIIVVCFNAGEELKKTMDSIFRQTCRDYEVLVQDGNSTDGSVDLCKEQFALEITEGRVRMDTEEDSGIYDAMNKACRKIRGDFVLFLNCGDYFATDDILERVKHQIEARIKAGQMESWIFYGDRFNRNTNSVEYAAPEITPFVCFRNIPCHQSCIYSRDLFSDRGYDTKYVVRADYEHFLWSFFSQKAKMQNLGFTIASYEGGGFSETTEHQRLSQREHREITAHYLNWRQRVLFNGYLWVTLAPIRHWIASNPKWSREYNRIVKLLLHR